MLHTHISTRKWRWTTFQLAVALFQKLLASLCKPVHDIINYSTCIFPLQSGKCRKKGGKLQKFQDPEKEKSFLDEKENS